MKIRRLGRFQIKIHHRKAWRRGYPARVTTSLYIRSVLRYRGVSVPGHHRPSPAGPTRETLVFKVAKTRFSGIARTGLTICVSGLDSPEFSDSRVPEAVGRLPDRRSLYGRAVLP